MHRVQSKMGLKRKLPVASPLGVLAALPSPECDARQYAHITLIRKAHLSLWHPAFSGLDHILPA